MPRLTRNTKAHRGNAASAPGEAEDLVEHQRAHTERRRQRPHDRYQQDHRGHQGAQQHGGAQQNHCEYQRHNEIPIMPRGADGIEVDRTAAADQCAGNGMHGRAQPIHRREHRNPVGGCRCRRDIGEPARYRRRRNIDDAGRIGGELAQAFGIARRADDMQRFRGAARKMRVQDLLADDRLRLCAEGVPTCQPVGA